MDHTVEKSCWSITLWTLAAVLAAVVLASLLLGTAPVDAVSASTVISN